MSKYIPCPCRSKALYHKCCKPYHDGTLPPDALALMRSRFSAYALNISDYIIATTHIKNPHYQNNLEQWKSELDRYSRDTSFDDLKIIEFENDKERARVVFIAALKQSGNDISFTERSDFVKENGQWLYRNGTLEPVDNSSDFENT